MKRIDKEKSVFTMSKEHKPVERISSGETVIFETYDCYTNQIKSENDLFANIKKELNNPATGPLFIEGAEVGDILKIEIVDIKINTSGVMTARPKTGALGEFITKCRSKIIPIQDNLAIFNDKIKIPVNPMIGVIGTAPETEDIPCGTPGRHGGNMDTKLIRKGNTLYLPVFVEGAKLAMGDLHAVMGDGEVSICGVEVPGVVTVTVNVIKGKQEEWPMLETDDAWYALASGKDLDEAADLAMDGMLKFLQNRLPLSKNDIISLLSITGNLEISQVVDPLKTVRMSIPKYVLEAYKSGF